MRALLLILAEAFARRPVLQREFDKSVHYLTDDPQMSVACRFAGRDVTQAELDAAILGIDSANSSTYRPNPYEAEPCKSAFAEGLRAARRRRARAAFAAGGDHDAPRIARPLQQVRQSQVPPARVA